MHREFQSANIRKGKSMKNFNKHGVELLRDSSLNKSTAFTEAEREAKLLPLRPEGIFLRCAR